MVPGVVIDDENRLLDQLFDVLKIGGFRRITECDCDAFFPGPPGTTDAMHIAFCHVGKVIVDDVTDSIDVDAS